MNFENTILPSQEETEKKRRLYPERASAGVEEKIEELKKIESGEIEKINLSEEERESLLNFDDSLGALVEDVYTIKARSTFLYADYVFSEKGRDDFRDVFGLEPRGETVQEIRQFLIENRENFLQADEKKLAAFAGRSRTFAEDSLLDKLKDRLEDGNLGDVEGLSFPESTSLTLNPKEVLKKIKGFREIKKYLKETEKKISDSEGGEGEFLKAQKMLLEVYRKRVNILIMILFDHAAMIKKMSEKIGEENLTEEEKDILQEFKGIKKIDRTFSRFDLLNQGGERKEGEKNAKQIPDYLADYAKEQEDLYFKFQTDRNNILKENGLDPEKALDESIKPEEFLKVANEILEKYGLLSEATQEDYSPSRRGPAPDEKWQCVVMPQYKMMSVDQLQKVIKIPERPMDVVRMISVLGAHEIEGHVIQNENVGAVSCRLAKKVGFGRGSIFAEGGAMKNQNDVSQAAFGLRNIPQSFYVRAMIKKIEGGTFVDCLREVHNISMKTYRIRKERGELSEEEFIKKSEKNLKYSLGVVRRIFRSGSSRNESDGNISTSKDTVYLEQQILLDKLEKNNALKYAFIKGMDLSSLISLAKLGMIDLEKVIEPKNYSLEIWKKIKHKFVLDEENV